MRGSAFDFENRSSISGVHGHHRLVRENALDRRQAREANKMHEVRALPHRQGPVRL